MSDAPAIHSGLLAAPGIAHAFFTRQGGVSSGVYASLNGGVGSRDEPERVTENRRRMASALGAGAAPLLVPYQIHSPDALIVDKAWDAAADRPRCDALATATPGLAIGVTGADCGMILFCDPAQRVIGAAHAGWKGALTGVLEATLSQMEALGARRSNVVAALGPTIARASYEVGPEFIERFVQTDAESARYFTPSPERGDRARFDLPAYIGERLARAGVGGFDDLGLDTYADDMRFFSYRRSVHRDEPDYGRLVSAIMIAG